MFPKLKKKNNQCENCNEYKNNKCKRIGTNGQIGICWMEKSEGKY